MLAPPDRVSEIVEILERIKRGESIAAVETEHLRKDGRRIHVSLSLSPIRDAAGQIVGVSTIVRDVTDRKRMEQHRHAAFYARSLIEVSLDPLVVIGPDGKVTDVNKATEEATGVAREQLIGTDFSAYFTDPAEATRGYRKVLSEGEVRDYALTIRHVSGRTMDVLYSATVYHDEAGQLAGRVCRRTRCHRAQAGRSGTEDSTSYTSKNSSSSGLRSWNRPPKTSPGPTKTWSSLAPWSRMTFRSRCGR